MIFYLKPNKFVKSFLITRDQKQNNSFFLKIDTMSVYKLYNKLGVGSYGIVVKGKHKKNKRPIFAIKKIFSRKYNNFNKTKIQKKIKKSYEVPIDVYREISIFEQRDFQLNKNYVVPLEEVLFNFKEIWLIYPCYLMDLDTCLSRYVKEYKCRMPLKIIKTIIHQCISAVNHLHRAGFIHRDIKPSNYLVEYTLSSPGKVLLTDFGLSRKITARIVSLEEDGPVFTIWYRPLELILGAKEYEYSVDVWSLGCIFGELLHTKPLFQSDLAFEKKDLEIIHVEKIFSILGFPEPRLWKTLGIYNNWTYICHHYRDWISFTDKLDNAFFNLNENVTSLLKIMLDFNPKRIPLNFILQNTFFEDVKPYIFSNFEPKFFS